MLSLYTYTFLASAEEVLVNKSTVETLVKQPLLGNGRLNTQQWAAHATIEES
jgi:hypothetical protein